jgi:hypothetical protein
MAWWNDSGVPYIAAGRVVETGKKRKKLEASFETLAPVHVPLARVSATMGEAIGEAIVNAAGKFCPQYQLFGPPPEEPRPWKLAVAVARLMRLKRKLQKHGLIKRPTKSP